tara:strand:+ start:8260 stop:8832 length:573 start_codon:yes stop_codon:yes gene_type:complete
MKRLKIVEIAEGNKKEVVGMKVPGAHAVLYFATDTQEVLLKDGREIKSFLNGPITGRQVISSATIQANGEPIVIANPSANGNNDLCIVPRRCYVKYNGGDPYNAVGFFIKFDNPIQTTAFTALTTIINGSTNIFTELTNNLTGEWNGSGGSGSTRGSNLILQFDGAPGATGTGNMEIIIDYTLENYVVGA